MHVGAIEEVLGVYRRLSRLGKRPKAFRAPVGDNPSTGRTVTEQGSLTVCSSLRDYSSIQSFVQMLNRQNCHQVESSNMRGSG